jgi:zinc/manganese transport system substrate-binding protein
MDRRAFSLGLALVAALGFLSGEARAQENAQAKQDKFKVIASFSILADIAKNIGGDRAEIASLVGAGGDAHVYTPTPADARKVAAAGLVIVNGLGFEGWLSRLIKSSNSKATVIVATKGITPRKQTSAAHGHNHSHKHHDHEDADPHTWQSVVNAKIYATNIRDALVAADPAGAEVYRANATAYLARLDALDTEIRDAVATLPAERRRVISTHDAFGYFAERYGIEFIAPQGVSTESEATARDVARIITQIRTQKIPAVFLENISDPRLMRRIASESGAKLGGTLFSDALTDEKGPAPTYIDMMRYNIKTLTSALAG